MDAQDDGMDAQDDGMDAQDDNLKKGANRYENAFF